MAIQLATLLPSIIAGAGALISSKRGTNKGNKRTAYELDQQRRDYEADRAIFEERDARRGDSVEFLKAIAKAKGYNIPDAAFAMLNARGPFKMASAKDQIAAPPKNNGWLDALFAGLGTGLKTYGTLTGSKEASSIGASVSAYDGQVSPLAPPSDPDDEISFSPPRLTGGRR